MKLLSGFAAGILFLSCFLCSQSLFAQYLQWEKTDSTVLEGSGTSVGYDADDNIYVGVHQVSSCYYCYDHNEAVIKYDSLGNKLWSYVYPDTAAYFVSLGGMAVTAGGYTYVTGRIAYDDNGLYEIGYVMKLSPSGNLVWLKTTGFSGEYSAIEIDSAENVYVSGGYSAVLGAEFKFFLNKLDSSGNSIWTQTGNAGVMGRDIALDQSGNVVIGTRNYSDNSVSVLKYSGDGLLQWSTVHMKDIADQAQPSDMMVRVNPNDEIFFSVWYTGNGFEQVVAKLNMDGSYAWTHIDSNFFCLYRTMEVDENSNVYLAGTGYIPSTDTFYASLLKMNSAGDTIWFQKFYRAYFFSLKLKNDNVYLCGGLIDSTDQDYFTVKEDEEGNIIWMTSYNSFDERNDEAYDLCIDHSGSVIVTGITDNYSGSNQRVTTIKYQDSALATFTDLVPNQLQLVSVFPNPAHDQLYLHLNSAIKSEDMEIEICNSLGSPVIHKMISLSSRQNPLAINVGQLTTGNYLIRIYNDKFNEVQKLIIE